MKRRWIKNFDNLATTSNRKLVLQIAEAGLDSIDTENVILNSIKVENNILRVKDKSFDLSEFKNIKVIGFGKASCDAAVALEKVLDSKIQDGVVIGLSQKVCRRIKTFVGTHPEPTFKNIDAGEKIYEMVKNSTEEDILIVLVSGGGSSLLCSSKEECIQEQALYEASLKSKETIIELNTVRKHIPSLKGGNLAKLAYPATVVGLIFSDVPGDHHDDVASGPTYKDETTVSDAQKLVEKHNLGNFSLEETPKDDKYFEKVFNFVLVSNKIAIDSMDKKAKELGFNTDIISTELYDETQEVLNRIFNEKDDDIVVLAAGESQLTVTKKGGSGGRNLHMGLKAIDMGLIDENSIFIPLASDGMDNSDAAGAIVDQNTVEKIKKLNLDVRNSLESFDSYPIFQKSGDMIITGPTGANVSDLMILMRNKYERK